MSFQEIQFPTDISYGSKGGPGFRTDITTTDSGYEFRRSKWSSAKRMYDVSYGVRSLEDIYAIYELYLCSLGSAMGFRYKDWSDYSTALNVSNRYPATTDILHTDVIIATGDGSKKTFQLKKNYSYGSVTRSRTITKPVSGTVKIGLDSVNQASGWTVDTTTGIVTFTTAPTNGAIITAGFEFDVPVRFGEDVDEALESSITGFDSGSVSSISLKEITDFQAQTDYVPNRGSGEFVVSADKSIQVNDGFVQTYDPSANVILTLPDPTNLEAGHYFLFVHAGTSNTITVKDDQANVIGTLTNGQSCEIYLTQGSGSKFWMFLA